MSDQPQPATQTAQGDDTARLDWYESNPNRISHWKDCWHTRHTLGVPMRRHPTFREAIDHCMSKAK